MTARFASLAEVRDALSGLPQPDANALELAHQRNAELTKPPGALGRLEDLAMWYCSWRGDPLARVESPQIIVFAGNHGVTSQGVSAFPSDVTAQMVANFEAGGAAVNQLSDCVGASLTVKPLQLDTPTRDFTQGPAMSEAECLDALNAGVEAVDAQADVLVVGEMGIGNTTCAAAMALALFGGAAQDWTGAGTGLSGDALRHKADVVSQGVEANKNCQGKGLDALRCLGGREIAAMTGAILQARLLRIPVILDGFICTAAAATLHVDHPGALDHTIPGHVSAESAHAELLRKIGKDPILSLGMRLGEASGGALAISILKAALACHSGMATFAEAGISDG
ncbi:nicotinate-nucleotide--dimethylbenzimidazole phosphoribosyltransferase [Roseovarius rhodophyticola]|uniref:Nicotinate-nucleotide--dimethylbenzimidazole phosphoribosyltransferase n=1 Tax=Roseovarius rhodophyticola TaxID=3080827 RepID=A0ABZ2TH03_9RHOB|nr:nicotinate-nucleotide--dimethylbenzimidazole phosphoribosyltransferase [Roseovarius sp. W115]MDV2929160.1 nicotinate-nucleotide--dimethylbenzimidazole phosphoribosyltransferase [Roseovarius sp. W115]